MKALYSPDNAAELAVLRSIFDAHGINYFVHNDFFGGLEIGFKVDLYNARTIMVPENEYEEAREILEDFLAKTRHSSPVSERSFSLGDRVRMVIEFLLFSWIVPGNRWKKKGELGDSRDN